MKRRVLNFAAGISLLLCIATVTLWIRSYSYAESMTYDSNPQLGSRYRAFAGTGLGKFFLSYSSYLTKFPTPIDLEPPRDVGFRTASRPFSPSPTRREILLTRFSDRIGDFQTEHVHELFGFGFGRKVTNTVNASPPVDRRHADYSMVMPYWALVTLFAVAPALYAVARMKARHLHRAALCPTCGYDLRATPHRCPECGATAPK